MLKKLLIVIDMQNDFTYGSLRNEDAIKVIKPIKEKLSQLEKSAHVVFTKDTHYDNYLSTLEGQKLPVKHCILNTKGHDIVDELKEFTYRINTKQISKETFGYSDWKSFELDKYEEVELVGVCTDICVISNALLIRALYPNLKITIDSKCCAGLTIERHDAALLVASSCQIDVI